MHISDKLLESFATGWVFTKICNDLPQAIIHSLSICFRIPTIEICKREECWCVVHQILRCEFGHAFQTAFTRSQIERRAVMEMLRVQVTCFLDNSANATTSFVIAPDIFSKDRHLFKHEVHLQDFLNHTLCHYRMTFQKKGGYKCAGRVSQHHFVKKRENTKTLQNACPQLATLWNAQALKTEKNICQSFHKKLRNPLCNFKFD